MYINTKSTSPQVRLSAAAERQSWKLVGHHMTFNSNNNNTDNNNINDNYSSNSNSNSNSNNMHNSSNILTIMLKHGTGVIETGWSP